MNAPHTNPIATAVAAAKGQRKGEEIEPSELWLALTTLPRPTKEIPIPRNFPGTETPIGNIVMWPLTQEEQMAANAEADRWTKNLLKDPQKKDEANLGYQHTYTNEVAVQVLYRACRDVKNIERPAFPSPTLMRQKLSTDEIGVLFSEYCTVQAELGPIRAHMTAEEADTLILRIADGGSAFFFDSCSWDQQRTLVLSMASRLVSCWTDTALLGRQPDVSSSVLEILKERVGEVRAGPTDIDPETFANDDDAED